MLILMLLNALLIQTYRQPPDVWVRAIDDSRLRVLVRPWDERTVKAIALEQRAKHAKPARHKPHTRVTLSPTENVCFTFSPIAEPFDVIVTLSDDAVYRIGKKGWNDPNSKPAPPPPYRVETFKSDGSLRGWNDPNSVPPPSRVDARVDATGRSQPTCL